MPLLLEGRISKAKPDTPPELFRDDRRRPERQWRPTLEIGLINNMPDAALRATERQFIDVLGTATGDRVVRLHLYSLPSVERGSAARAHIRAAYANVRDLRSGMLDALVVTGAEPKAPSLTDEPYWRELTEIIDWAEHNTISTVWSCLAAHAAVLHLDGIGRHRLAEKRFGLFDCAKLVDDPLLEGLPDGTRNPHSRWNDLKANELRAHGYAVLTHSPEAGVDLFTKQWNSLFVFFQGHPEYGVDTLFREYRRDMTRYLRGERDTIPGLPSSYFDRDTERRLARLAARAPSQRGPEAQARLPGDWALQTDLIEAWRSAAVQIYRNWLHHVATVKSN